MKLVQIFQFLHQHNFIKAKIDKKSVSQIQFLSNGDAVRNNIRTELKTQQNRISTYLAATQKANSENTDNKKFLFLDSQNFRTNFLNMKQNFLEECPLMMKEEEKVEYHKSPFVEEQREKINLIFNGTSSTLLATNYFYNESSGLENFYKIQRERKICWMKYSSKPSRYYFDDLQKSCKLQSINIKASFPFGAIVVEKIVYAPLREFQHKRSDFQLKDVKLGQYISPAVIRSEIHLETAACVILLDSLDHNRLNTMTIKKKIAPYQCAIFCLYKDKPVSDLIYLSTHLTNIILKSGIAVLNVKTCPINNLQQMGDEMDQIGIPYCVILDENTLHMGLMKLRNRDTKLAETIHITDLPAYLHAILKT